MLNKSTDSFFLFSHRLSSTSKARRTGWSCLRRKSAGRSSSPRAVSSQTPATPTPPLTTKDLRTVNCPGHPHPHIAPPHVTRGAERGWRGLWRRASRRNSLSFSLLSSCHLHTHIRDSQTQWLEGFLGGKKQNKNKKKRKCYRKWARLCILTQYTITP